MINIDETFNLTPGHYTINFELGYDVTNPGYGARGQHLLDYTRPELSISTTDLNNLTVYYNNWDIHKLFDSVNANIALDPLVSKNRGVDVVEKLMNNLSTSVKFNKVKL
jgi:hypothetical protein